MSTIKKPNGTKQRKPKNKLDQVMGEHTVSIIVGILFITTLAAIVILILKSGKPTDNIIAGLIVQLGVLGNYFMGSTKRKQV